MPIYEYICDDCQTEFEKLVLNKQQEITCPKCASKEGLAPAIRIRHLQWLRQRRISKILHVFLRERWLLRRRLRLPLGAAVVAGL
ncbi:MAG TPA: zinc ribbon domain-containing protein [Candidatus Acidoferrum sp.]|jgi:putative FmdB family regulatory protein|nr:zinc ribbon domain-containing protein [Candidatus Acidoferrum sp.]